MNSEKIRVVLIEEGGAWVAQCLEVDVRVQASDLDDVAGRLEVALRLESEAHDGDFSKIGPAPQYFQEMWGRTAGSFQPRSVADGPYDMAICA